MPELSMSNSQYNNCFVLGSKMWNPETRRLIKVPMYIDRKGWLKKLYDGKAGELCKFYELSYGEVTRTFNDYFARKRRSGGAANLRVSLYLDNAMFGNLHIFVIDFDKFDEKSSFFIGARGLADKVTRSQGGGYHMFYGVDKNVATPLFDSINLLTSCYAKSYISSTGNVTLDEANKVDFFCDAYHLMYEWEPWDNTVGLTDKTQSLYELIRDSFPVKRAKNAGQRGNRRKSGNREVVLLEEKDELELLSRMSGRQQNVFDNLKMISSDCPREEWFRIGIDIWNIFGDDLGGDVFRFWSEPGESFNPQGCSRTWGNIMERGPDTNLWNDTWRDMFNVFDT